MPTRPSFAAVPPAPAEQASQHDPSLHRAQAIQALEAPQPFVGSTRLAALFLATGGAVTAWLAPAWEQVLLGWLAAVGVAGCLHLYGAVRDLQSRVNALQELLRQSESERR